MPGDHLTSHFRREFDALYQRVLEYLSSRDVYVQDLFCGADPKYQLPSRSSMRYTWHNLFVHQLFIRPTPEELKIHKPEFTIVSAPSFLADPQRDDTQLRSLRDRELHPQAGHHRHAVRRRDEKSIFGVMEFLLPQSNVFPMRRPTLVKTV